MPNPVDDIRPRILRVLNHIFHGDMIEVYGAYAAIFPRSWEKELDENERIFIPNIAMAARQYDK